MELTYRQEGNYLIPNLYLDQPEEAPGKYGLLRKRFLKEHQRGIYTGMLLKRNITKLLRLNYKEKQRLHNHAGKCGLSEEAYLRSLLNGVSPREMPPPDYHAMVRELNAIGTVLNQIAARANATGFFLAGEYEVRYRQLMEKVLEIQVAVTLPEKI